MRNRRPFGSQYIFIYIDQKWKARSLEENRSICVSAVSKSTKADLTATKLRLYRFLGFTRVSQSWPPLKGFSSRLVALFDRRFIESTNNRLLPASRTIPSL